MYFFKIFYLGIISILKSVAMFFKYFFIGLLNVITFIPRYFVIGLMVIFGKRKKEKNSKEYKRLSFAILGLSLSIYLVCVFIISRWYVQGLKIKHLSQDIINSTEILEKEEENNNIDMDVDNTEEPSDENEALDEENKVEQNKAEQNNSKPVYYPNDYWDYMSVSFMSVNFKELLAKNPDTVGWIKVEGTKVNYPIVQTDDNDYYLNHAFNGKKNSGGWIFADYRVDFEEFGKNTIIYGHNMNNKTMFGSIPNMLKNSYLKNSDKYYIKISTPSSSTIWKVFSIYTIEPEVYYLKTNFKSESYENFLNTIKDRSIYDFGVEITTNDKVLTLSTCDNTGTKRIVVHAKMVSIEYK